MCSPEEMRMNRRTEFLIPELAKSVSVEQSGKGDYSSGAVKSQKNSARKREKFAVVVGSFKDKLNAENIFNQLNKSGLESKIFKTNNFFVVEIDYKDLKSANDGLGKLKLKYPDARIF
jgi:cell division protein FtsN